MGSLIMNGSRGVVYSLFALFGNGGETTHVVSCLCKASFLENTLLHFEHSGGGETVVVELHAVLICLSILYFFPNTLFHFEHVYFIVASDATK